MMVLAVTNRLEELSKTRTEDRTLKTLVFSQFATMLSVLSPSSLSPCSTTD